MRTMVITGVSSGIGYEVLKMLSADDIHLIAIVRNEERALNTMSRLKSAKIRAQIDFVCVDLSSMEQIVSGIEQIKALLDPKDDPIKSRHSHLCIGNLNLLENQRDEEVLDALIHCAGAVSSWYQCTEEGMEMQFAVNHMAVFALSMGLLPYLKKSDDPKVIVISSGSHYYTKINWSDLMMRNRYSCLKAYKRSKLCNVLFVTEFYRRFGDFVNVYAVDPGLVNTDIGLKDTSGIEAWVWNKRKNKGLSPRVPASYIVRIVKDSYYYNALSGCYLYKGEPKIPSKVSMNEEQAKKLWDFSEEIWNIAEGLHNSDIKENS